MEKEIKKFGNIKNDSWWYFSTLTGVAALVCIGATVRQITCKAIRKSMKM